jgi:hypothetical protein
MDNNLELRMMGLVPYQLTGIQQGIQFGHAVVEYGQMIKSDSSSTQELEYDSWANNWKTFIVLNGGTTNTSTNPERTGTLNSHLQTLRDNDIMCSPFFEPDLGDQLTAIVFVVDERVFNKEKYPDCSIWMPGSILIDEYQRREYDKWAALIGEKNVFLRSFLKNFRLA